MTDPIAKQLAALRRMSKDQMRVRYAEVMGEPTRSGSRQFMMKRIAWRLQANAEGGLSDRARRRAEQLARESEVRMTAPKELAAVDETKTTRLPDQRDHRLPPEGSIIAREYRGGTYQVIVLKRGFQYDGEEYRSLSAVAKAICGSHCNGFRFFKLTGPEQ